jgi:outer membrane protein
VKKNTWLFLSLLRFNIRYTLFSLLFFGSFAASADDLLTSYQLALKNDPIFLAAGYENEALSEGVAQARSNLLPKVNLVYQDKETTQDIISSDNTVFASGKTTFPTDDLTITLSQPIYNYPSFVKYSQSKEQKKQADTVLEAARQDLILRVAELYFAVLAAQDSLELAMAEKAAVARQLKLAESRLKMGLARVTDLHDAKARYADVVAKEIEAETILDDRLQALSVSTGEVASELDRIKEEIKLTRPEPQDVDYWIKLASKSNPGILNLQYAVTVASDEIRIQKGGHYPTVDLQLRANRNETDGTLFGGGSEVETTDVMLNLNVPIYSGGYTSSKTREAVKRHQKLLQDLDQKRREVKREMRAAYFGMISSISRAEAHDESVKSQRLALDAKERGFKSGLYTVLAVLDAERDLYIAKRDYLQARYDYVINSLKLKHAVGQISEEDVIQANQWLE